MGGGTTVQAPAPPPPPPSPEETAAASIRAQIETLPQQLEAEREFGPQFAETQLEQLREFAPQFGELFAQLQTELGPQFREAARAIAPSVFEGEETVTRFLQGTDQEEFERLRPGLIQDIRAAQSQRGLGDISPLGSIDEAVQIERLRQSLKNRRLNIALSAAGRQPIGQTPTFSPTTGTGPRLTQNVSPSDIFGAQQSINAFNASVFGTQGSIFGAQQQAATARRGQNFGLLQSFIPDVTFGF